MANSDGRDISQILNHCIAFNDKYNKKVCGSKPKLAKFDQRKPFMDELVEISRKLKKRHIYMGFMFRLQSHSATIKKLYNKLKIVFKVHIYVSFLVCGII